MDYNLIEGRPRVEGKCDVCGGTLVTREDDTEEALVVRLRDYHEKTDPVLAIFARKEYVVRIDATKDKDEVQQAIRETLGLPASKPDSPDGP
jgi:adenylate kinase